MEVRGHVDGCEGDMSEKGYKHVKGAGKQVEALVRRNRAFGEYDKSAKEAQRRAAAYGRARGNA